MASEPARGCGYRKIGGMYLCGEYVFVACDRLPYELSLCPTCGAGIHITRAPAQIIPRDLFGFHQPCTESQDLRLTCFMCSPRTDPAYIIGVGEKHYPTPRDFLEEAMLHGISKRIAQIPKDLVLCQTIVYLAHPKAVVKREALAVQAAMSILENHAAGQENGQQRLIEAEKKPTLAPGIFSAFIPQKIEKLFWESELTDEVRKDCTKRGISPVGIPDGDKDHE